MSQLDLSLQLDKVCLRADLKYGRKIIDTLRARGSRHEVRRLAEARWDLERVAFPMDKRSGERMPRRWTWGKEVDVDYTWQVEVVPGRWFHLFERCRKHTERFLETGKTNGYIPERPKIIVRKEME